MKAAVIIKHGKPEGIEIQEVEKPSVKKDEILVKIIASTVTAGDVALRKQSFMQFLMFWPLARLLFGVKNQRKKILGHEYSGIVETIGDNVTKFKVGDVVFGTTGFKGGAQAEYITLPENSIISFKPENISFEEAAAVPIGAICALHLLKKIDIHPVDEAMIYGASGSIGTYAVQLAKYFGAKVTGVCSTQNIELVKSLGVDEVIDYKKEKIKAIDKKYSVIFDTVGKFPKAVAKKILLKYGRHISTHSSPVKEEQEYLDLIQKLTSAGTIKPVIDKTYPLENIMEAHSYVETGRKKGNVIIKIA
ncbi:MAG: NAD(P)-dependent alcohol dehydrogenase [Salinivirgaceae bacterium]|nr:MAG: NAD(P)-dependent alcohol dehydrogenase [Salinivirgaceae bacterium]